VPRGAGFQPALGDLGVGLVGYWEPEADPRVGPTLDSTGTSAESRE